MKWILPSKTFLLGEYVALEGGPAILLTTEPCFELELLEQPGLVGIHDCAPAALFWKEVCPEVGLKFHDPYQGKGGFGASSAQFIGAYWASCFLAQKSWDISNLLAAYWQYAWNGQGLRPSGYDVIAQCSQGLCFIDYQKKVTQSYAWPFPELSFFLIHSGKKLATHSYLQNIPKLKSLHALSDCVEEAKEAIHQQVVEPFLRAVNTYQQKLANLKLTTSHSLELMQRLRRHSDILAMKGCGALGADVLLVLFAASQTQSLKAWLEKEGLAVLASRENLYLQAD